MRWWVEIWGSAYAYACYPTRPRVSFFFAGRLLVDGGGRTEGVRVGGTCLLGVALGSSFCRCICLVPKVDRVDPVRVRL
jgi:hypothetical protein